MENRRFRPKMDKAYVITWAIALGVVLMASVTAFFEPTVLFVLVPVDLLVLYFTISPLVGYVELREKTVFIKLGFIMKREIPYAKIRGTEKDRKFYSDSMVALKTALEHVNIKYNRFDVISVSVENSDELMREIEERT